MEAATPGEPLLPLEVTTPGKTLSLRDVLRRRFTGERSSDMEMRHFGRMKQATGAKDESASLILIVAVERDTCMYGIKEVN